MRPIASRVRLEAGLELAILAVIGAAIIGLGLMPLSWRGTMVSAAVFALLACLVNAGLRLHAPHRHFGIANSITLSRAAFGVLLVGLAVQQAEGGGLLTDAAFRWNLIAAAIIALLLDGADGWIARRGRMTSEFGARFDTETDALFVMAMTLMLTEAGIVGAWVLANGLIYYVFRLASHIWPVLGGPLFPSWRRKAVCVVQIALLVAALTPVMPGWAASLCCLTGLALLLYSFGIDTVWLIGRSRFRYAEMFSR
ncbi:CDP-alcohol phosphatidyltransferase family protein [Rhodomicrobium vannielii]|uniref:CDP-alcohol phosphatidyltransferase family protein n=1 Tax=Rhodomicrobium vannielii TaxID=1069 RepID=UPI001AED0C0C|nr:CDP-alcohol phosphatidyltransferase family protein [Rhodomicrobium vannielii]